MRQGNESKRAALRMTAAMFRPHRCETIEGWGCLLMTLIFLEMSQDSRHHLLPLPRSKSVLLKQAPALRVDVVAVWSAE